MPRLLWMDRLRGAAILAVVVLHAELQARGATGEDLPLVHAVNDILGPVRMPLLVFLSGMLLAPALRKPVGRYLRGKLTGLLWPYLVWSAIDIGQLQWRLVQRGESLTWGWVAQVFYNPETYLWFLAYLFVYYLAARLMPAPLRTLAGPVMLALALRLPEDVLVPDVDKLVWLFGWFLLGDLTGRLVRHRLTPRAAAGPDPLGYVGRSSLVFYVSHLTVAIFVTDRLRSAGVDHAPTVFAACVVVPLLVGALLVEGRRMPAVDALFAWPVRAVKPGPLRSSGAPPAHDRRLRAAR